MNAAKFQPGYLTATPNALANIPNSEIMAALRRHVSGDWGEVDEHDRQENELALTQSLRLLSVYHSTQGVQFWIITEANRASTSVLLPEDY